MALLINNPFHSEMHQNTEIKRSQLPVHCDFKALKVLVLPCLHFYFLGCIGCKNSLIYDSLTLHHLIAMQYLVVFQPSNNISKMISVVEQLLTSWRLSIFCTLAASMLVLLMLIVQLMFLRGFLIEEPFKLPLP